MLKGLGLDEKKYAFMLLHKGIPGFQLAVSLAGI